MSLLLVARMSKILRVSFVCLSEEIQERHMIIELGNIHGNVNYLYSTWKNYQRIRKRLIKVEQVEG